MNQDDVLDGTDQSWPGARSRALEAGDAAAAQRARVPVTLTDAGDAVLAEDVTSRVDLPSFDTAAMDGWAVSGPGPWRVVGDLPAGRSTAPLSPDEAVQIATGAPVPPGATVLRSEHGVTSGTVLRLRAGVALPSVDDDIRRAGEEVQAGEVVLRRGDVLTPPALGLAAAAGTDRVMVIPKPKVVAFVLGDELVTTGVPGPGKVRDALSPQLPGWISAMHGALTEQSRIEDTLGSTQDAIGSADGDVIITTGGTAQGPLDHVRTAAADLGARWLVDGVAVRPGHPMKLGVLPDGRLWLALPGNPLAAVSALVTLGAPLLTALSGRRAHVRSSPFDGVPRPLVDRLERSPAAHRLVPAQIRDGRVHPVLRRGPAMLSGMASADVFAVVPPGPAPLPSGAPVMVLPLPWGSGLVV